MAYKVDIADTAKAEVADALEHIASAYASPTAMNSLSRAYASALHSIHAFPNGFAIHNGASSATNHTIRRIGVNNYGLFYEVHEEEQRVQIISFLHSRQNVDWHIVRDFELLE